MRDESKRKTNFGTVLGLVLLFGGRALTYLGGVFTFIGFVVAIVGLTAFIWGCMNYAEGKGYSRTLGMLGLLSIIGLFILFLLSDRSNGFR